MTADKLVAVIEGTISQFVAVYFCCLTNAAQSFGKNKVISEQHVRKEASTLKKKQNKRKQVIIQNNHSKGLSWRTDINQK